MSNSQIPLFTEDLNIISSLPDQPTMTPTELKETFDRAGNKIKEYLNNILVAEVNQKLGNLSASDIDYDDSVTDIDANNVQNAIEKIKEIIDDLSFTASNISYDNTGSGMSATNVQEGINELKNLCNSINSSLDTLKTKTTSYIRTEQLVGRAITVSAYTGKSVNIGRVNVPSGYELIGFLPLSNTTADKFSVTFSTVGNNVYAGVYNFSNAQASTTVSCNVIYRRTSL